MTQQAYMQQHWFKLLGEKSQQLGRGKVAHALGVSASVVTQVMNGTGFYGSGAASTDKVAARVLHRYGAYPCPHLTQMFGEERVITADECRTHAHRETAPIGSPGAMAHWRACSTCEHKPQAAPAVVKPPKPRKKRLPITAGPEALSNTATTTQEAAS